MKTLFAIFHFIFSFFPFWIRANPHINAAEEVRLYECIDLSSGCWKEKEQDLTLYMPEAPFLRREFFQEERCLDQPIEGWRFNLPHLGKKETTPAELDSSYQCYFDALGRLTKIQSKNQPSDWITVDYAENLWSFKSSSGNDVTYYLSKRDGVPQLDRVEKCGKNAVQYLYKPHPIERSLLLTEKREENGTWIKILYYEKEDATSKDLLRDQRIGKVAALYSSQDQGASYQLSCQIDYKLYQTIMTTPSGAEMHYSFNAKNQLIQVVVFNALNKTLYKKEHYEWTGDFLTKKTVLDELGNIFRIEEWAYDGKGNLISETLGDGKEKLSTQYIYDKNNQLTEERKKNLKTLYRYDSKSVLSGKFLEVNGSIIEREFYFYANGELHRVLKDDGSSMHFKNKENVTFCHFTKTTNYHSSGIPQQVEQGYLDLKTNEEILQEHSEVIYSEKNLLLYSKKMGPQEALIDECHYTYDQDGILLKKETHLGEIILYEKQKTHLIHGSFEQIIQFNPHNHIQTIQEYENGQCRSALFYTYDEQDRLLSITDQGGNQTVYHYDFLGRKVLESFPMIVDENDHLITYWVTFSYDILDRQIEMGDLYGLIQKQHYTGNDSIDLTIFSDGTHEENHYDLFGHLSSQTHRNGTVTNYTHDPLGRLLNKTVLNASGEIQQACESIYKGFHLIQENFSSGIQIVHEFDCLENKIASYVEPTGRSIHYLYDEKGLLISTLEGANKKEEANENNTYDEKNLKEISAKKPLQNDFKWVQNPWGQTVKEGSKLTDQGLLEITRYNTQNDVEALFVYNSDKELLIHTEYRYNGRHQLTKTLSYVIKAGIERESITNRWMYNQNGQLSCLIEAEGSTEERRTEYAYTHLAQIKTIQQPNGVTLFHEYNSSGFLISLNSSDHSINYSFIYDPLGNLLKTYDHKENITQSRTYNLEGQVIEEDLGHEIKIGRSFDCLGRQVSFQLPDQSSIRYDYQGHRLQHISRHGKEGAQLYAYQYLEFNEKALPVKGLLPFSLGEIHYSWTPNGKLENLKTPFQSQTVLRDEFERITSIETTQGAKTDTILYAYDNFSRLISEPDHQYAYDNLGRLHHKDQQSFQSNGLNQVFSNHVPLKYDINGNLTEYDCFEFNYDALNRLLEVKSLGKIIHKYTYDAFHRRLSDQVNHANKYFIYDGNWEMGCLDENQTIQELRIFSPLGNGEHGECIAFEINQSTYLPLYDILGSVSALICPTTQNIIETYQYSAFGKVKNLSKPISPWGYSNKRHDRETGLIHFERRDYLPSLHSWLTPDPIHFQDGPNRYHFNHNDPINHHDFLGMMSISDQWNYIKEKCRQSCNKIWNSFLFKIKSTLTSSPNNLASTLDYILGKNFLLYTGYSKTKSLEGAYGHGEVNAKVRVTFMNGILTDYSTLYSSLQLLCKSHGGVNIHYVYRPTQGYAKDILQGILVKMGFISSQATKLASLWKSLLLEMGGLENGGKIIHYAHSIGTIETLRALSLMSEEERNLIYVYTFGSPSLTKENPNYHIHHYVSVRDGVCFLDITSYIYACSTQAQHVTFVGTLWGIPFIDHLFFGQAYQDIWKSMGRTFTHWYGTLL